MNLSKSISSSDIDLLQKIGKVADSLNIKCNVVGGYVRDLLLGKLSKDIDFVCEGNGVEFAQKVNQSFAHADKLTVFKTYGTAMFKVDGYTLEFVGARKESYNQNSRNPKVSSATLLEDFERRDFTVNAMAIALNHEKFGQLIDPFNGKQDLDNKLLITPLNPDVTFSDDPLRMFRAIRFATQLKFNIDDVTFKSIKRNAARIKILSTERITDEVNKMILSEVPSNGFYLMDKADLLEVFLPELTNLKGVETVNEVSHKDNFVHTLQVLDNLASTSDSLWLRWAAILHDIAKPQTKRFNPKIGWTFHGHEVVGSYIVPKLFKRLKLPLDDKMKMVQKLVLLHLRPIALTNDNVSDSAVRRLIVEAGEHIDELMLLCKADITSKNEYKVKRYYQNFLRLEETIKEVETKDNLRNWKNPISGEYIISKYNLKPGKIIGELKSAVKEAILDGIIENNLEQAQKFLEKEVKKQGI